MMSSRVTSCRVHSAWLTSLASAPSRPETCCSVSGVPIVACSSPSFSKRSCASSSTTAIDRVAAICCSTSMPTDSIAPRVRRNSAASSTPLIVMQPL